MEPSDVVERSEYSELENQLSESREQRDQAIERAVSAENALVEAKEKYANTFLKTRNKVLENHKENAAPVTIENLFK